MVNKTKGNNGNLNTVTIGGRNYALTATIKAIKTGRLNTKNAYIVNSVYNGNSVGSITNTTVNPNRVIPLSSSAKVNTALSRSVLAKANNGNPIILGASAKTVLGVAGLNYFLGNGNITITA